MSVPLHKAAAVTLDASTTLPQQKRDIRNEPENNVEIDCENNQELNELNNISKMKQTKKYLKLTISIMELAWYKVWLTCKDLKLLKWP